MLRGEGVRGLLSDATSERRLCSCVVISVLLPNVEDIILDNEGRREPEIGLLCWISRWTLSFIIVNRRGLKIEWYAWFFFTYFYFNHFRFRIRNIQDSDFCSRKIVLTRCLVKECNIETKVFFKMCNMWLRGCFHKGQYICVMAAWFKNLYWPYFLFRIC